MEFGRIESILIKVGIDPFAFNWQDDEDLVRHLSALLQEIEAEFRLDLNLAALYAGAMTDDQAVVLAAAAEWRAAGYSLLRPQIFKLLGEHARLDFENAEAFNTVIDRLLARGNELVNAVAGNIEFLPGGAGRVSDGFYDPCGNRYPPPVTLGTKF